MWRLHHGALPLDYRTKHVGENENGDCPWCEGSTQSRENLASHV
ncbi:16993_t:CDS:1, partial [Gigaspora rosea]